MAAILTKKLVFWLATIFLTSIVGYSNPHLILKLFSMIAGVGSAKNVSAKNGGLEASSRGLVVKAEDS